MQFREARQSPPIVRTKGRSYNSVFRPGLKTWRKYSSLFWLLALPKECTLKALTEDFCWPLFRWVVGYLWLAKLSFTRSHSTTTVLQIIITVCVFFPCNWCSLHRNSFFLWLNSVNYNVFFLLCTLILFTLSEPYSVCLIRDRSGQKQNFLRYNSQNRTKLNFVSQLTLREGKIFL